MSDGVSGGGVTGHSHRPSCLQRSSPVWPDRSCPCWWTWSVCCCPCRWIEAIRRGWRSCCVWRSLCEKRERSHVRQITQEGFLIAETAFWFASSPLPLSAAGKTNLKDRHYRLTHSIFIFAALGFQAHLAFAVQIVLDEAQRGNHANQHDARWLDFSPFTRRSVNVVIKKSVLPHAQILY